MKETNYKNAYEKAIKEMTEREKTRLETIQKGINMGCDKCSHWDSYYGCDRCERIG